jgi:branched-chain amino acid transport system permease protein
MAGAATRRPSRISFGLGHVDAMAQFLSLFISGIAYGAVLVVMALGLLLLFRATGVINFAHGDFVTTGAYVALWCVTALKLPVYAADLLTLALMFGAGVLLERIAYAPLRNRSPITIMIATLALGVAIEGLLDYWQGSNPKAVPGPFGSRAVSLGSVVVTDQRLLVIAITAVAVLALLVMFHRTSFGRQVRALAWDAEVARMCGIRTRAVATVSFGLSAMFAGLAAIMVAPTGFVDPTFGFNLMVSAFAAAALLGFGSFLGVVVGGLAVGLSQQLVGGYLFPNYADILPFVLILILIRIRPQGVLNLTRTRL